MTSANPEVFESLVRRTEGLQPWRRLFHVAGGLTIATLVFQLGLGSKAAPILLAGALGIAVVLDVVRLRSPQANMAFFRLFSALASPREARSVASSTWYLVGALAVLVLAPPQTFLPVMLVLAFADPAASVVGRLWGKRPLGKGTWEGTTVFYLVACLTLAPGIGVPFAAAVAAVVAMVEMLPVGLDDNFTIPVATAAALWMLGLPA